MEETVSETDQEISRCEKTLQEIARRREAAQQEVQFFNYYYWVEVDSIMLIDDVVNIRKWSQRGQMFVWVKPWKDEKNWSIRSIGILELYWRMTMIAFWGIDLYWSSINWYWYWYGRSKLMILIWSMVCLVDNISIILNRSLSGVTIFYTNSVMPFSIVNSEYKFQIWNSQFEIHYYDFKFEISNLRFDNLGLCKFQNEMNWKNKRVLLARFSPKCQKNRTQLRMN